MNDDNLKDNSPLASEGPAKSDSTSTQNKNYLFRQSKKWLLALFLIPIMIIFLNFIWALLQFSIMQANSISENDYKNTPKFLAKPLISVVDKRLIKKVCERESYLIKGQRPTYVLTAIIHKDKEENLSKELVQAASKSGFNLRLVDPTKEYSPAGGFKERFFYTSLPRPVYGEPEWKWQDGIDYLEISLEYETGERHDACTKYGKINVAEDALLINVYATGKKIPISG